MARRAKLDWLAMMDIGAQLEDRLRAVGHKRQNRWVNEEFRKAHQKRYPDFLRELIAGLEAEDAEVEMREALPARQVRLLTAAIEQLDGMSAEDRCAAFDRAYDDEINDDDLSDAESALRVLSELYAAMGQHVAAPPVHQVHDVVTQITSDVAAWASKRYGVRVSSRHVETCHDLFRREEKRISAETRDYQPQRTEKTDEIEP